MARLTNPYEAACRAYLRSRRVAHLAVDERRRTLAASESLKNLDFIVASGGDSGWLVDVKGRRFPSGRRKQFWKNWSTEDDLVSLSRWEQVFGGGFRGLFVFAYNIWGEWSPVDEQELFQYGGQRYAFIAIRLGDYVAHARQISPRWRTVAMPTVMFRRLARPLTEFLAMPPASRAKAASA